MVPIFLGHPVHVLFSGRKDGFICVMITIKLMFVCKIFYFFLYKLLTLIVNMTLLFRYRLS